MSRRVIEEFVDDLDGTPNARTVQFSIDAVSYTVDVAEKNEQALRDALAPFIAAATKLRQPGPVNRMVVRRPLGDRERNGQIRTWAADNGVEIAARGRIATAVVEAFDNKDVQALRAAVGAPEPVVEPEPEPERPAPKKRAAKKVTEPEFVAAS